MNAIVRFTRGMLGFPVGVKLWLGLLIAVNMVAPLVFYERPEAQVVVLTFVVGAVLMVVVTALSGFTRLLGLGHILWVPLLVYLAMRLGEHPANEPYGLWMRFVIILNALSLVVDAIDVGRYLRGDRDEVVTLD